MPLTNIFISESFHCKPALCNMIHLLLLSPKYCCLFSDSTSQEEIKPVVSPLQLLLILLIFAALFLSVK